jgi:predicted dehydrogenase
VQDHSASTGVGRFARMIEHFGDCIADGSEPEFSGRNGLQMVRIGNALLASSQDGRTVSLA